LGLPISDFQLSRGEKQYQIELSQIRECPLGKELGTIDGKILSEFSPMVKLKNAR
jgi:hypothetical protein